MKIHFAEVERGNENNPHDEWSSTLCGLEYTESMLTNRDDEITCKRCLKSIKAYKEYLNTLWKEN